MISSSTFKLNPSTDLPTPALTEELVAKAIAGVVGRAKENGQSLTEVTAEVLSDDQVLDAPTRYWLSEVVSKAWELPIVIESQETIPHVA